MGMRHASRHHIWRGLAEIWPRYGQRRGLTRFGATCPACPAVDCWYSVLAGIFLIALLLLCGEPVRLVCERHSSQP